MGREDGYGRDLLTIVISNLNVKDLDVYLPKYFIHIKTQTDRTSGI